MVRIQHEAFDVGAEIKRIGDGNPRIGAVACFVGVVRDINEGVGVTGLTLEHYPAMTKKSIGEIVAMAETCWNILSTCVVHRSGALKPTDPIVLVIVAAEHRRDAFAACEFIMDHLKTHAPFWKKEQTPSGERWVEARAGDEAALARWDK